MRHVLRTLWGQLMLAKIIIWLYIIVVIDSTSCDNLSCLCQQCSLQALLMCGYTRCCCLSWCCCLCWCCCVATLRFVWSARRFNVPLFTVIASLPACCCCCGVCGVWRVCIEVEVEDESKSKSFGWLTDLSYVAYVSCCCICCCCCCCCGSCCRLSIMTNLCACVASVVGSAIFINFCKSAVCPSSSSFSSAPPSRLRTTPRPL